MKRRAFSTSKLDILARSSITVSHIEKMIGTLSIELFETNILVFVPGPYV